MKLCPQPHQSVDVSSKHWCYPVPASSIFQSRDAHTGRLLQNKSSPEGSGNCRRFVLFLCFPYSFLNIAYSSVLYNRITNKIEAVSRFGLSSSYLTFAHSHFSLCGESKDGVSCPRIPYCTDRDLRLHHSIFASSNPSQAMPKPHTRQTN